MKTNNNFGEFKRANSPRSISRKIFTITVISLVVFTLITILVQVILFEKLYFKKKSSFLKTEVQSFRGKFSKLDNSLDQINLMREYEDKYGITIAIADSNGRYVMSKTNVQHIDEKRKAMMNEILNNIITYEPRGKSILGERAFTINFSDYEPKVLAFVTTTATGEYLIGTTSLEQVDEAVDVSIEIYIYYSIAAMILIIIMAHLYSKSISRPLIKINDIAKKMAGLDFKEKCIVDRDDEIGDLSNSLNIMSNNLDNSLKSLKKANSKLILDIEKERAIDKMRKDFIADVSHELKTPIALIKGYAEGIQDEVLDSDEAVKIIIDESDKMNKLVLEMLSLSQLENGTFKLKKSNLNICDLINNVVEKSKALSYNKNLKIHYQKDCDIYVNCDYMRIEQVMLNFLSNAVKNCYDGGNIILRSYIQDGYAWIDIENEGNKIPEDEIERIWEKFYKVDKGRNRREGTGLGLAITKSIVELHSGNVYVKNTEDGVKFSFKIPLLTDCSSSCHEDDKKE